MRQGKDSPTLPAVRRDIAIKMDHDGSLRCTLCYEIPHAAPAARHLGRSARVAWAPRFGARVEIFRVWL